MRKISVLPWIPYSNTVDDGFDEFDNADKSDGKLKNNEIKLS